jgi:predicted Zn-dependent protease
MVQNLNAARAAAESGQWSKAGALVELVKIQEIRLEVPYHATSLQRRALAEAAEMWETALEGSFRFKMVSPGEGQVSVKFAENVSYGGTSSMARATWSRQLLNYGWGTYGSQTTASIEIRTQLNGTECPLMTLRHALAHELGHVLGLDDSSRLGDVMGPQMTERTPEAPGSEEKEALLELRDQAQEVGTLAQILSLES